MHTMATHHRGTGCPIDRDIDLYIEGPEAACMDNDNGSISGLDATVALGGLEAEGNPNELLPTTQTKLTVLTWEINELHQWVVVEEGQPVESLDHIEWELQNLSHASTTISTYTY